MRPAGVDAGATGVGGMTPELAATRAATDIGSGSAPNVGRGRRGCAIGAPLNDTSSATGRDVIAVDPEEEGPKRRRVGPEEPDKAEDGRGREVEDRAREADGGEGRRDADREAEPEERFASKVSPVERRPGARRSAADSVEETPVEDNGGHVNGLLLGVAEAEAEGGAGGREELAMAKGGLGRRDEAPSVGT